MRLLQSVLPMVRKTNKPQRIFVVHLVRVLLRLPGPATFRHFSRYSAYHAKPFARQFAKPFDFVALNKAAILTVVPAEHEPALALDASFMAKRGQQTYGLERCWNSGHGRAERGLEISVRGWVEITPNSAYGLSVGQPPPSHPAEPESTRIAAYLEQFSRVVTPYQLPPLQYGLTDGAFSTVPGVAGVHALHLAPIGQQRGESAFPLHRTASS